MILDFKDASARQKNTRMLKEYKGEGTNMISLYVSKNPLEAAKRIRQEKVGLGNIKCKSTQKTVSKALEKILYELKNPPEPPFVIFSNHEESFIGSLPEVLAKDDYVCDKIFELSGLEEHSQSVWGLVVADTSETSVGVWQNGRIKMLGNYDFHVPAKIKAGGQSSQRFEETRMIKYNSMIDQVVDKLNTLLPPFKVSRVFVGGTKPTNEKIMSHEQIHPDLKPLLVGPFSVGYTCPDGLSMLVKKVSEQQKDLMKEYLEEEKCFSQLSKALACGRGGGLDQFHGVPLENPTYYLVKGVTYNEKYCSQCLTHSTTPCQHAMIPLASVPGVRFFGPGKNSDFLRTKYRGVVTY